MAQQQDIEFRLMIRHKHHRPSSHRPIRILNLKPHLRQQQHDPFKRTSGSPLALSAATDEVEDDGCEDAVGGAEEEGEQ